LTSLEFHGCEGHTKAVSKEDENKSRNVNRYFHVCIKYAETRPEAVKSGRLSEALSERIVGKWTITNTAPEGMKGDAGVLNLKNYLVLFWDEGTTRFKRVCICKSHRCSAETHRRLPVADKFKCYSVTLSARRILKRKLP